MNRINLKTTNPEFENDIAEEIRLFVDMAEVVPNEPWDAQVLAELRDNGESWHTTAEIIQNGSRSSVYDFDYPADLGDLISIKRHKKRALKIAVFRAFKQLMPDTHVPWGSLTGIRPTKLLRELEIEEGVDHARNSFSELFDVSEKKYQVAKKIVDVQAPIINSVKGEDIDIYIGIPYCKTKCLYCSFPSGIRTDKTDMRSYIDALKGDIYLGSQLVKEYGYKVRCSYMGGGTPTILTVDELGEVLEYAYKCYGTLGSEFTVEAGRPDTITREKLMLLRDLGVNRVSINPQTMNDKTLELIGRSHTSAELVEVYYMAKELGFLVNMDMIIGLPGEGIREIENTLLQIGKMKPDNLTVHTLAIKKSSRLIEAIAGYRAAMPEATVADDMVNICLDFAAELGMQPYYMYRQKYMRGNLENIGYCMPGCECVYNIDMMEETTSIMAHGAGSMSKRIFEGRTLRVERIPNPKDIQTYITKLDKVYEDKKELYLR